MNEILILEPAKEFINSLNIKMQAKTFRSIDLLQEFGYIKKTNKTSKREIEKAISLINRYLQEVEDESI